MALLQQTTIPLDSIVADVDYRIRRPRCCLPQTHVFACQVWLWTFLPESLTVWSKLDLDSCSANSSWKRIHCCSAELEPVVKELETAAARFAEFLNSLRQSLTPTPASYNFHSYSDPHISQFQDRDGEIYFCKAQAALTCLSSGWFMIFVIEFVRESVTFPDKITLTLDNVRPLLGCFQKSYSVYTRMRTISSIPIVDDCLRVSHTVDLYDHCDLCYAGLQVTYSTLQWQFAHRTNIIIIIIIM